MPPPKAKRQRGLSRNDATTANNQNEPLPHVMDMALRICAQHPSCHSMSILCKDFRSVQTITKASAEAANWDPVLFRKLLRVHHHSLLELSITDVDLKPNMALIVQSLKTLRQLSLRRCNISTTGLQDVWVFVIRAALHCHCWRHLQELDLEESVGAGSLIGQLVSRSCQAAYWQTMHSSTPQVPFFPNLTKLNLSRCVDVDDASMLHLLSLTTLTSLNLSGCVRVSAGYMFVAHMSWLRSLDISCTCEVDGLVVSCLTVGYPSKLWHDNLKHELIFQRELQGLPTSDLCCPQGLTSLRHLSLIDCTQVDSSALEHISRLTALTFLDLGGCKVLDAVAMQYVAAATALKHLGLRDCYLLDEPALMRLSICTSLTHLDLSFCTKLDSRALRHIGPCTGLTHLNLHACSQIDAYALQQISSCTALKYLSIVGCSISTLFGAMTLLGPAAAALTHLELPSSLSLDPAGLRILTRCTALEHLVIPGHTIDNAELATLISGSVASSSNSSTASSSGIISVQQAQAASSTCTNKQPVRSKRNNPHLRETNSVVASGNAVNACSTVATVTVGPVNEMPRGRRKAKGSAFHALLPSQDKVGVCGSDMLLSSSSNGLLSSYSNGLSRLQLLSIKAGCVGLDVGATLRNASRLTSLRELDLFQCQNVSEVAFKQVAQLASLQKLVLREVVGVDGKRLRHLTNLTNLTWLDLTSCVEVDGLAMAAVAHLTKLTLLDLTNCPQVARRNGLEHVSKLSSLRHLDLSECFEKRSGTVLRYVAALTGLTRLILQHCSQLDAQDLRELAVLPALQHLDLHGCYKPGLGSADRLASVSCLTALRYLELGQTRLHMQHVSSLRSLRVLGLSGCLVSMPDGQEEGLMQYLGNLTKLQALDLRFNSVRAHMLSGVSDLVALTQLDMRDCEMLDAETLQHIMALNGCQVFLTGQQP